jgi:23S rRNA (uracil1939-C5)-methyltransferase
MEGRRFEAPKPVSAGDIVTVEIVGQGGQGDGIGKVEDFVIFVKGGKRGEKCRVKITEVKRTFATGEKVGLASEMEQEMDEEVEGMKDGPSG